MALTKLKTALVATSAALLIMGAATIGALQLLAQSQTPAPGMRLRLPVGTNTPMIAMGATHGVILASDGSLWSWGENYSGWPVLGLGNIKTQTCLRRIGEETDWVHVSSSAYHVMALKSDGTIWGWGQNLDGQIGDGTSGRSAAKRQYPVPGPDGNNWKQVAAGDTHSCAIKNDGTLWAWGNNWTGQLGLGTTKGTEEPAQVGSGTNWVKVWAGGIQTVGLQTDGSLWFWGSLTGESGSTNRFLEPTRVSHDTNWVDVCFGYFSILAIKADGTLWAWGRNAGIYTGAPIQPLNPTPARVGKETDWKACSSHHAFYHLLTKKDGSLWALDASDYAYVNKRSYKPAEFKRINLAKDIVAFGTTSSRYGMGIVLTPSGEVWTWGRVLGEYKPTAGSAPKDDPGPVVREEPWLLPNMDPSEPSPQ